jgi:hyperosmotically inducible protein
VYRSIYSKPSLQRYQLGAVPPIHIIVKNGDVTLEGVVANSGDKDIAGIAANGVGGVHKVVNNLKTESSK